METTCEQCGSTDHDEYRIIAQTGRFICRICVMDYLLKACDDENSDGVDSSNDLDNNTFHRSDESRVVAYYNVTESINTLRYEGVYFKQMLRICANCCKGPSQEALMREFVLSSGSQLDVCSACSCAYFCSALCRQEAEKFHWIPCYAFSQDKKIACVSMTDPVNCIQIFLDPMDRSFDRAIPSKVMVLCDIPLALLPMSPGQTSQVCLDLLIEPDTGLTPAQYQYLGKEVLICRQDRMPITLDHMHLLTQFIAGIVAAYREAEPQFVCKTKITAGNFISFLTNTHHPRGASW